MSSDRRLTLQEPTYVKEVIVPFSELTTSYTLIYDFGFNELVRAKSYSIGMKNTMNTDVILKFGSANNQENEKTVDAGDREALDGFRVVGKLYAKTESEAMIGRLKVWVW